MDEWSTRKKVVLVLCVALALSPFLLLTEMVPNKVQTWVDENPESPWAPWYQLKLAGIYNWTLRKDQMYDCYTKYLALFGKDNPNYDPAEYVAIDFERARLTGIIYTSTRGMEELTKFMQKYPGTPQARQAEQEYNKLRMRM